MNFPSKILLVDLDPPDRGILRNRLRDVGYQVEEESDWNRGLELARDNSWNAIVVPTICDGVLLGKVMAQAIASRPDRDLTALVVYEARNGAVSEQGPQALASGADAFVTRGELSAMVSTVERLLEQRRFLWSQYDAHRVLKHRRRKLEADPADTLGSAVPGGVEAVMLTDSLGTVLASDAGAGRLMGSSPVGQTLADALPNLRADALVRRAANQTLVSPPFEQPGGLGPAGTPLELNIVPLLSDGQFPKLKLALVAQKPMTRGCGSLLAGQPSWGIARHGGLKQAGSLAYGLGSFLGRSPLVESLRESARQASFGREPVLIIAPSGAGARSLAKAMHFTASPLAPLEQLEAGNLPGRWILDAIAAAQSRGASGQERSYLIAHVNRLSHADQAALVDLASYGRLLLTSSEPPQALHPRLAAAVADRFLVLPTLREHLEDLPLLASHFVQQMHPMARIAPEAVEALMRYPWPGNATELENCLRQAYLAACPAGNGPQAALIERHHLPPGILHYRYPGAPSPSLPIGERKEWEISEEDPVSFDLYERKVILRALDHCKGNRLACARLLRLGKSTLYRKLKRLGIDVEE